MTDEIKEEPRKVWRVLRQLSTSELEDSLNKLAADGYQVFKAEQVADPYASWIVLAFDPALLGEGMQKRMAETIAKMTGLAQPGKPFGF